MQPSGIAVLLHNSSLRFTHRSLQTAFGRFYSADELSWAAQERRMNRFFWRHWRLLNKPSRMLPANQKNGIHEQWYICVMLLVRHTPRPISGRLLSSSQSMSLICRTNESQRLKMSDICRFYTLCHLLFLKYVWNRWNVLKSLLELVIKLKTAVCQFYIF